MGIPHRRSKRARWMKLTSPDLLVAHMRHKDFSQARLGRAAGTSRQFIHLLIIGGRNSCSERVGKRIEECSQLGALIALANFLAALQVRLPKASESLEGLSPVLVQEDN